MTESEERPATLASGFDFARRQRDPGFRQLLRDMGWEPGQQIVIALDDEPVVSLLARMIFNETSSPCLIAIPHGEERFGFRFLRAEVGPARRHMRPSKRVPTIEIRPTSSIGMLYDSLGQCGEFVPSEWSQPVVFKREPLSA